MRLKLLPATMNTISKEPLPFDVELAIVELSAADESMAALIHAVGPCTMVYRPTQDPFEALCEAIVYQQLSGKAASTIYGRFCTLLEDPQSVHPARVLELDAQQIRGAGLSRAKTAAILDLAEKTIAGVVPDRNFLASLSDDEIIARLTSVRGIGPWTVKMLLIFRLGRPDVLPAVDLGVRKGLARLENMRELPNAKELQQHAEKWRPWRSVASWYLWRALELDGDDPLLLP